MFVERASLEIRTSSEATGEVAVIDVMKMHLDNHASHNRWPGDLVRQFDHTICGISLSILNHTNRPQKLLIVCVRYLCSSIRFIRSSVFSFEMPKALDDRSSAGETSKLINKRFSFEKLIACKCWETVETSELSRLSIS